MLTNPMATRYTNGIKTSANTYLDSVIISGMQVTSITSIVTDFTKVNGVYPHAQVGLTGAEQRVRTPVVLVDEIRERSTNLSLGTSSANIAFFGGTSQAKPTITGSRGSNAALTSLLTQLEALGLITDSTT